MNFTIELKRDDGTVFASFDCLMANGELLFMADAGGTYNHAETNSEHAAVDTVRERMNFQE